MKHSTISARSNPWVQQWLRWQSKANERKTAGMVWLEGEHLVKEALERSQTTQRFQVVQLVMPDTLQGRQVFEALSQTCPHTHQVSVVWLHEGVYSQLCSLNSTPSACVVIQLMDLRKDGETLGVSYSQAAVVLDGLQDPGNVGTVLRLCAAFGMGQAFLSPGCASAWGAKALRAGQGAQLAINIVEDADLLFTYAAFKSHDTPIVATSLQAGSIALSVTGANRLAKKMVWVFGHEGRGISIASQHAASQLLHIPMAGGFESLNVASAAAICLWQWSQIEH